MDKGNGLQEGVDEMKCPECVGTCYDYYTGKCGYCNETGRVSFRLWITWHFLTVIDSIERFILRITGRDWR